MSTTEAAMSDLRMDRELMTPRRMADLMRADTPIVPKRSIAGRALVAVVAIMTYLASLTTGAVMMVRSAASEWQSDVAREVTVQVRPSPGRDIDADVQRAAEIVRGVSGVGDVRPFTKEESARLLEPWLGAGIALDDLPVPRIVVVKIPPGGRPDLARLRVALAERVPGATLDDHRAWVERMRAMARTTVVGGLAVLLLVLAATMLSVTFATRGAMAANRPIVEVLHFVGAKDNFIASQFQRHFLLLGLQGGLLGGGMALLTFALGGIALDFGVGTAGVDQLSALFGTFSLGVLGYGAIAGQIVLVAAVTALTSRRTVNRTLETVE